MIQSPYYQWNTTRKSKSDTTAASSSSIYGALPVTTSTSFTNPFIFHFTNFNPSLLNCSITGPNSEPHFYVMTDSALAGYTVIKSREGRSIALIEWKKEPKVEIRGVLQKQAASNFLQLSSNRTCRTMCILGQNLTWVPQDNTLCLYSSGPKCDLLARITAGQGFGSVPLEMAHEAYQAGLLQPCIVAAVLLLSGRSLE